MGSRRDLNRFHRNRDPWENPNALVACRYAVIADADDEELIDEARKATHDQLIANMGARRLTGVRWHAIPASDLEKCREALGSPDEIDPRSDPQAHPETLAKLAEWPGGALIIAMCVVSQPLHKAHLS